MKTMFIAFIASLSIVACSPVEGEELTQDPQGITNTDAGHLADGAVCQVCFYYTRTSGYIQGCKTATSTCGSCSALGCQ
jgi:hypothetical protein